MEGVLHNFTFSAVVACDTAYEKGMKQLMQQ